MSLAALANGGAGVLRRKALVLKNDPEGNGKYIAGLNEIRVRTREVGVVRDGLKFGFKLLTRLFANRKPKPSLDLVRELAKCLGPLPIENHQGVMVSSP